ncbi:MAG: hypothetical protein ACQEQV_03680 [Fibrobacterota bacterium]
MSFRDYLQLQIEYIHRFARKRGLTVDEAADRWVRQGFAELFARKYRCRIGQPHPPAGDHAQNRYNLK